MVLDNQTLLALSEAGLRELVGEILPESATWPVVKTQGGNIVAKRPDKHAARQKRDPTRNIGIVQVTVDGKAKEHDTHFWPQPHMCHNWNSNVVECRVLREIDEDNRVLYVRSKAKAGGIVAPRDFVLVQGRKEIGAGHQILHYWVSVEDDEWPPVPHCVRGHLGPSCWVFAPCENEEEDKTNITIMYNDDFQIPALLFPLYNMLVVKAAINDAENCIRYLNGEALVEVDHKIPIFIPRHLIR